MLDKIKEGYDVVYAACQSRRNDSWFKRKTAEIFYWLMKKFGADIVPNHADFRMVTRRALNAFLKFHENNFFIRATFPIVGFSSCVVYYDRPERLAGETKYPFLKMLEFAINGITSFSVVPLRICSMVGLLVSFLALLMLFWSIVSSQNFQISHRLKTIDKLIQCFIEGIEFSRIKLKQRTLQKTPSQLAVNLGFNEFRGRRKIQLNIQDSRV